MAIHDISSKLTKKKITAGIVISFRFNCKRINNRIPGNISRVRRKSACGHLRRALIYSNAFRGNSFFRFKYSFMIRRFSFL